MTDEELLDAALAKIQSRAIRAWAESQRRVILKHIPGMRFKPGMTDDERADVLSTFLTLTAIG